MGIKTAVTSSIMVLGIGLLGASGCTDSTTGSANGHPIGYHDTPPAATPSNAAAPGTPAVNDPSNPLPPGGMTVPPPAHTPAPPARDSGGSPY
jgi:hypothetical protein